MSATSDYASFDFMEMINSLTEQILESVREEREEDSFILLSTLLFHVHNMKQEKVIDNKLYRETLDFYGRMHFLLLSV